MRGIVRKPKDMWILDIAEMESLTGLWWAREYRETGSGQSRHSFNTTPKFLYIWLIMFYSCIC